VAAPIDLPCELNLGIVYVIEPNVCPRQREQLRDSCTRQRRERKEGAPRLLRG